MAYKPKRTSIMTTIVQALQQKRDALISSPNRAEHDIQRVAFDLLLKVAPVIDATIESRIPAMKEDLHAAHSPKTRRLSSSSDYSQALDGLAHFLKGKGITITESKPIGFCFTITRINEDNPTIKALNNLAEITGLKIQGLKNLLAKFLNYRDFSLEKFNHFLKTEVHSKLAVTESGELNMNSTRIRRYFPDISRVDPMKIEVVENALEFLNELIKHSKVLTKLAIESALNAQT